MLKKALLSYSKKKKKNKYIGIQPINKIEIPNTQNLYNSTKMNCEVGNLEAQMQMDVAFLLWSLFSESSLQKRNPIFILWRYHRYGCFQSLNSMQDLKPNFRSGCLLPFLCFWEREREREAWGREGKRNSDFGLSFRSGCLLPFLCFWERERREEERGEFLLDGRA